MTTCQQYIERNKAWNERNPGFGISYMIGDTGSRVSGIGYQIGDFEDGTVLRVGADECYSVPFRGPNTMDILSRVGRVLTTIKPADRAAWLAGEGCSPGSTITINETVWNSDGSFVGIAA